MSGKVSEKGFLLVWLKPATAFREFDAWRLAGGFARNIPGVGGYTVQTALDPIDPVKPHRYSITYQVDDLNVITPAVYEAAIAEKPECVQSSEWHLYRQIYYQVKPGMSAIMPGGSVVAQVGQDPEKDEAVIKDNLKWFTEEHVPMLMKVTGWTVGLRGSLVSRIGGEESEFAAAFIAIHRYQPDNGLEKSPEWCAASGTAWSQNVRSHMVRPYHRRVWRIDRDMAI
ncbi:hypothetical protein H2204_001304 [Knufia peltigerae]|uniref:Uncharacterized protein n=1 Tax=Knufia peltigerae TaxID=1002370 RepID=A0AA38YD13_9EURO|nr:hypothetical protein H2204_001304 [Knufia peltigerae]